VDNALQVANSLGLGQGVIGATIVALGTGAEIIALAITAARKQRSDILMGGIIGSFVYNLLVTLGLAAVIHPVTLDLKLLFIALPVMCFAFLEVLFLTRVKYVGRSIGYILIAMYVAYLIGILFSS